MLFQPRHKLVATPEGIFLDGVPLYKFELYTLSERAKSHILRAAEIWATMKDEDWGSPAPHGPNDIRKCTLLKINLAMASPNLGSLKLNKNNFNTDQPRCPDGRWGCGTDAPASGRASTSRSQAATADSDIALNWVERQAVTKDVEANAKAFFASFTTLTTAQINAVYDQVIRNITEKQAWEFSSVDPDSVPIVLTRKQMDIVQDQINQLTPDLKRTVQQQFNTAVSKGKIVCPECKG